MASFSPLPIQVQDSSLFPLKSKGERGHYDGDAESKQTHIRTIAYTDETWTSSQNPGMLR